MRAQITAYAVLVGARVQTASKPSLHSYAIDRLHAEPTVSRSALAAE